MGTHLRKYRIMGNKGNLILKEFLDIALEIMEIITLAYLILKSKEK